MAGNSKATILIISYNEKEYLPRAIESCKKQTYGNTEIIIGDDGSNDGTEALINSYIEEGKIDIEYHWKENGGKHTAFQEALNYINEDLYKYVVPADSDDTLTDNALEIFKYHWDDIFSKGNKNNIGYIKSRCVRSSSGLQFPYKTPNEKYIDTTYQYVTFQLGDFCEYDSCATLDAFRNYSIAPKCFWLSDRQKFSYFSEGILWARAGHRVGFRYIPDVTRVYYEDAPNSLVRTFTPNYKGLYPRFVHVKYVLPENFDMFLKYQRIRMLKMLILYTTCWYLLDVSWKECFCELNNNFLRLCFILLTPFSPIMAFLFKKR